MSKIEALKEEARRFEQKEEWQKACDHYLRAIDALDEEEQPDIGLYNRVGDLLIRLGNYESALEHFDRAAELYLEADLPNNAIAICKKVIRHLPNRTETYLRMGKIRAEQGFLVDARDSYLTYVEKAQEAGDMEEALKALVEFAQLAPEDTDVRLAVAEQLTQHERPAEALEQLSAGYAVLVSRGDDDGAETFREKILELDPDADLDALAQAQPSPAFSAFEDAAEDDDGGFHADFGEIVLSDGGDAGEAHPASAEVDPGAFSTGGDVAPVADESDAEADARAAMAPGDAGAGDTGEDEDDDDGVAVGDFAEISLGGEDGDGGEDADGFTGEESFGEEEEDGDEDFAVGGDLPLMSFDDGEDDEDDVTDLPLMTDFADEEDDDDQVGVVLGMDGDAEFGGDDDADDGADVGAEPLPFLTDEDDFAGEDGDVAGPEDEHARADGAGDALADAMEDAAAAGWDEPAVADPRTTWETARAACAADPGDVDAAQALVEVAFRLDDPGALVESYLVLGDALSHGDQTDRARGVYEQVLALDPDNDRAREALADGEAEEAAVEEAAESPSDSYVDLGALIFDEEKDEKTTRFRVAYEEPTGDEEADFRKMLSQFKAKVSENFDISDVRAHHDLGTAYKEMGLLDEAVEKFQEALRASPVHLPTYELLGQTFMDKGEPVAAVRVLERALRVPHEIEDELIGIYYFLARAHEETGNKDAAIEFYDRVFALDINFSDVTERLRRLR